MKAHSLIIVVSSLMLTACPSTGGTKGDPGPQGPVGPAGPTGPAGAIGPPGPKGDVGATGPMGAQGLQGPAGMVLVLDGGVVTGPAGSSVFVTPISVGSQECPTGGVRITQLLDGGISNVCNGAIGPMGAQGPAGDVGPKGSTGEVGPKGDVGAAGPKGDQGPTGLQGPAGAQGPAGQVYYLDGGVVLLSATPEFAGFTTTVYNGNLGGYPGANAKCAAEFAGSYFCTRTDYEVSNTSVLAPVSGAWVDSARNSDGSHSTYHCYYGGSAWTFSGTSTGNGGQTGQWVKPTGDYSSSTCDTVRPISCCRQRTRVAFRGFTTASFNGNLGGYPGANAKCSAEFAGSYFCTRTDYEVSNTSVLAPASGAWVDSARNSDGSHSTYHCYYGGSAWTFSGTSTGNGGQTGQWVKPTGDYSSSTCDTTRPIACCSTQ